MLSIANNSHFNPEPVLRLDDRAVRVARKNIARFHQGVVERERADQCNIDIVELPPLSAAGERVVNREKR